MDVSLPRKGIKWLLVLNSEPNPKVQRAWIVTTSLWFAFLSDTTTSCVL